MGGIFLETRQSRRDIGIAEFARCHPGLKRFDDLHAAALLCRHPRQGRADPRFAHASARAGDQNRHHGISVLLRWAPPPAIAA